MITSSADPVISAPPDRKTAIRAAMDATGEPVRVKRDYFSKGSSDMSVFTDDGHLKLLDDSDPTWWLLKDARSGQIGYVPSKIVLMEDELLATANAFQNLSISTEVTKMKKDRFKKKGKSVSFSEAVHTEHIIERIEYEDDEIWPLDAFKEPEEEEESEEGYEIRGSSFLQSALIDEAVRKALGIGGGDKSCKDSEAIHLETARKEQEANLLPSTDDFVSSEERLEFPRDRTQSKSGLFAKFLSPLMRSQSPPREQNEMVKVFAGNFSPLESYKTCLVDENSSMLDLEDVAKRLYRLEGDGEDYVLTLVHSQNKHILPVQSQMHLGTLKEITKIATIEDGYLPDVKGKPVSRHRKKVPRSHLVIIRRRKMNINFKGIKNGFATEVSLARHPNSDFPTNYQFVLNMKVAPFVRQQFYVWVELESKKPSDQESSRIALAVKALTTVDEIIERSLKAMEVGSISGVSYDLVLSLQPSHIHQYRFDPNDGREVLSREMTINDVRSQWSHIDPSGFLFILRSFVCVGFSSSKSIIPH